MLSLRHYCVALALFLALTLETPQLAISQLTPTHVGPTEQAYGGWYTAQEYFMAAQSGFYKSSDGVKWVWIHNLGQDGASIVVLPTHEIFLFHYNDYEVSSDDGVTWNKVSQAGFSTRVVISDSLGNMYAGENDPVYVSKDKGLTWTKQDPGTSPNFFDVSVIRLGADGSVYAANQGITGGMVYRSTDQGSHWKLMHLENMNDVLDLDVYPKGTVIIRYSDRLLRSDDGGKTWQKLVDPKVARYPVKPVFVSANEGYALGDLGKIVRTLDGGMTWDSSTTYSTVSGFTDLFRGAGNELFGASPDGLYRLMSSADVSRAAASAKNLILYPNPAHDRILITNPKGEPILQYSIFDERGETVMEGRGATISESGISISGLAPGTYHLVARGNGFRVRSSFVRQ